MLCPVMQSSHQNAQHWKQFKLCALLLSQFPHFTPVVLHCLMTNTSNKLLMRKLVGNSQGFPLLGILNCFRHSGHVICMPTEAACTLKLVQTVQAETVQAGQLLWLGEHAHTHRTGYFVMKIIKQGLYIHDDGRKGRS